MSDDELINKAIGRKLVLAGGTIVTELGLEDLRSVVAETRAAVLREVREAVTKAIDGCEWLDDVEKAILALFEKGGRFGEGD